MNQVELGKRICHLRKSKGLTQLELVGDYMTRNALSMIERGKARPSISVLEYLANRLGVTANYLLQDDIDNNESSISIDNDSFNMLIYAKDLLKHKSYYKIVSNIKPEGDFKDEIYAIRSIAHIQIVKQFYNPKKLMSKKECVFLINIILQAIAENKEGLYANEGNIKFLNRCYSEVKQMLYNLCTNNAVVFNYNCYDTLFGISSKYIFTFVGV